MDSQRSLRKIQRVQRAGVTRAAGQRRPVGFTLLLAAIAVVGIVLTGFARSSYRSVAVDVPRMSSATVEGDRFRDAFGVYLCDRFIEPLSDVKPDTTGIHSHGDGLIQIHPSTPSSAGSGAKMGLFFDAVGLDATAAKVVLPADSPEEEKTWESGTTTCEVGDGDAAKDEKGQWVMLEYPAQAGADTEPTVYTDGFSDLPLRTDGQAFVLAFLPTSEIDGVAEDQLGELLPPSIEALKTPDDEQEPAGGELPPVPGEEVPADDSAPVDSAPADDTAPATDAPATTAAG